MNHSNHVLNDLVAIARDGQDFYQHAASKVGDPELKALFARIGTIKAEIVTGLSAEIKAAGGEKPTESGTIVGEISKVYSDLRALAGSKDYQYVAQLEHSEDRLVKAFEDARNDSKIAPSALSVLNRLEPEVRQCHEMMRTRKLALKKAA
jgi:uncharacterized protein (TIGR02284 family)